MINLTQILNYSFANNLVKDYLIALAIFIAAIIILKIFKHIILKKLKNLVQKTKTDIDDLIIKIIEEIGWPFYFIISLYISIHFIKIPDLVKTGLYYLALIIVVYYVVKGIQKIIDYSTNKIILKRKKEKKEADTSTIALLSKILKIILWLIAVILILSNIGYNLSTVVAGLGIGGIAIAFAVQNILSDIFSSFSIYFDRPFEVGDFIIIGSDMGVVKKIGIKSTRIETLQGEELVVSNKELTETRVHNYKKMQKRRISFNFGVIYETPTDKLKKIPQIVKEIIDKTELADLDRVHFKAFGDFSLNFEVIYYLRSSDYNKYMDTQQEINIAIKEHFEKQGIEMAYPTQTVFVKK